MAISWACRSSAGPSRCSAEPPIRTLITAVPGPVCDPSPAHVFRAQSLAQLLGVGMLPPIVIAVFLKEAEGCGELLRGFLHLAEPRQVHTIDPDGSYWRNSTESAGRWRRRNQ